MIVSPRGKPRTCQEASDASFVSYVPCGDPAVCVVDNGDEHPYFMCAPHADHNVRNRGAVRYELAQARREL